MRAILNFSQVDNEKMETVKKLIDYIAENGNSDCSRELQELSQITGKEHDIIEFAEYWGWTDLDALAEKTMTAEPPCVRTLCGTEIAGDNS